MSKISVIIPVYNAEQYISRCIDSVLSQTFSDFELMLINDGSQDNSGMICDEYAVKDSRTMVFHKENGGVSSARNLGLDNVNGEWITFVDADDMLYPFAFDYMLQSALSEGADVVMANVDRQSQRRISKMFITLSNSVTGKPFHEVINRAIWGYLFNSKLIQDRHIRFNIDLAYSEDTLFLYYVLDAATRISILEQSVYLYNKLNENSVCSSTNGLRKIKHQINAVTELKKLQMLLPEKWKRRILSKEIRKTLSMGFLSYHMTHNKGDNAVLFNYYKKQIGSNMKSLLLFYWLYIQQYFLVQRRKIIVFHKD